MLPTGLYANALNCCDWPADCRWVTPDNPHGIWRPVVSNSTLVLHYAYATPGDVAVKAGRSCPEEVVEAALAGNTGAVCKRLDSCVRYMQGAWQSFL